MNKEDIVDIVGEDEIMDLSNIVTGVTAPWTMADNDVLTASGARSVAMTYYLIGNVTATRGARRGNTVYFKAFTLPAIW
jgi:hypothetical protein